MASASDVIKTEKTKVKKKRNKTKKQKKPVNEIDEIFRAAKGKRERKDSDVGSKVKNGTIIDKVEKGKKENMKKVVVEEDKEEGSFKKKRRSKTADGLTVYSAEELGIGNPNAGGTPLCPFDCSCCF